MLVDEAGCQSGEEAADEDDGWMDDGWMHELETNRVEI